MLSLHGIVIVAGPAICAGLSTRLSSKMKTQQFLAVKGHAPYGSPRDATRDTFEGPVWKEDWWDITTNHPIPPHQGSIIFGDDAYEEVGAQVADAELILKRESMMDDVGHGLWDEIFSAYRKVEDGIPKARDVRIDRLATGHNAPANVARKVGDTLQKILGVVQPNNEKSVVDTAINTQRQISQAVTGSDGDANPYNDGDYHNRIFGDPADGETETYVDLAAEQIENYKKKYG